MKTKIDFLNTIERNTKDDARYLIKTATLESKQLIGGESVFTVNSVKDFYAGDDIYMQDSEQTIFIKIKEVNSGNKTLKFGSDIDNIALGTQIKKSDAEHLLLNAFHTYSKFRPLFKVQNYSGIETSVVDLPEDWSSEYSAIKELRVANDEDDYEIIPEESYCLKYDSSGELKLYFVDTEYPEFEMVYQIQHEFNTDANPESTTPDSDFYAICDITSAYYFLLMASKFSQTVNPAFNSELTNVNVNEKVNPYLSLYKHYLTKASVSLNIDVDMLLKGKGEDEASSGVQEVQTRFLDNTSLYF